jgi:exonuclease III
MPTPEQMEGEMRFVSWNAKVNRDPDTVLDQLHDIIGEYDPQIICLQEFHQYTGAAKKRFGKEGSGNWHVYAHNDWLYSNNCPVMVRAATHDQQTRGAGWDTLRYRCDWSGPKGKVFDGRTWTYVKTNSCWIMSVHRCTGGEDANREAFAVEYDALVKWARNHAELPVVIFGDHNISAGNMCPGSSARIADAIGGAVLTPGGGVDYAVKQDFRGGATKGGKHGSDHAVVNMWREP